MSFCFRHPTLSAKALCFQVVSLPHSSVLSFVHRPDRYCYHDLMNSLNNFDKTYQEYSLAFTNDLIRFWRSKVRDTAGRRDGEGIHVNTGASAFIFKCCNGRITD